MISRFPGYSWKAMDVVSIGYVSDFADFCIQKGTYQGQHLSYVRKAVRAWIFCFIWFIQKRWINPKYRSACNMINLHPDWWHILWCFVGSLKFGVGSAPFVNLQGKMMQNCYGKQLNELNWTNRKMPGNRPGNRPGTADLVNRTGVSKRSQRNRNSIVPL